MQACSRPLLARGKDVIVRYAGSAPSSTPPKNFFEAGQIDRGFFEGTAMLGASIAAAVFVPFEAQLTVLKKVIEGFRVLGLDPAVISDEVLVADFIRKNALAAQNVLIASPTFYFLFSWITGQSVAVCTVRAITGTMRIVPFMGVFYGAFALLAPFATQYYVRSGGTSYADSASSANMALMLGGARAGQRAPGGGARVGPRSRPADARRLTRCPLALLYVHERARLARPVCRLCVY